MSYYIIGRSTFAIKFRRGGLSKKVNPSEPYAGMFFTERRHQRSTRPAMFLRHMNLVTQQP